MKRLFFALWPDQNTRQQCQQVIQSLPGQGKPVVANNLHVTLVFLGNIDQARQIAITKAANTIDIQPMRLIFNHLNFWKKPAVVCLVAEQVDPAVSNLVAQLSMSARQLGIELDDRPYKPHITLLRKAKSQVNIDFNPIHWQSNSFCLVESCSTTSGVEYRVIERWTMPD
ncbi:2'-5' RNA ligase [Methylomonas lenta]|uniref:RNA 2',3'-cyclic phosphodiesterase n=1 Tax=Methylomonas lenta TaxID=980561 RepID=A0A177N4K9_9GAMM|nr:RNA 2',3'-cyclic phosphodiesterase [Methylomonas lenta]OAI12832.1 2'-5' RNA ligase [Methylomonas lenta]